jgi:hypothetical protein
MILSIYLSVTYTPSSSSFLTFHMVTNAVGLEDSMMIFCCADFCFLAPFGTSLSPLDAEPSASPSLAADFPSLARLILSRRGLTRSSKMLLRSVEKSAFLPGGL